MIRKKWENLIKKGKRENWPMIVYYKQLQVTKKEHELVQTSTWWDHLKRWFNNIRSRGFKDNPRTNIKYREQL